MKQFLWAFVVLFVLSTTSAMTDEPKPPRWQVPVTISSETQDFLKARYEELKADYEKPADEPTQYTHQQWAAAQAQKVETNRPLNAASISELAESVHVEQLGGVHVHLLTPKEYDAKNDSTVLLYIHGGGYVFGTAESTYFCCLPISKATGLKVYSIDYRLAPQHPYPAALTDCITVYRAMVEKYEPQSIGVFGHSAGGSLLLSMLLQAQAEGLPMPGAVASLTPWSDLSDAGDSYLTLDGLDPMLQSYNWLRPCVEAYAKDAELTDPLVSPVYGHYPSDFPPTLIQTGTRDLFLSNSVRLYRQLKRDGVDVDLSVWDGMWHCFQAIPLPSRDFPEGVEAREELAQFFTERLGETGPK